MKQKKTDKTNRVYKFGQVYKLKDSLIFIQIMRKYKNIVVFKILKNQGTQLDRYLFPVGFEGTFEIGSKLDRQLEGPVSDITREVYDV